MARGKGHASVTTFINRFMGLCADVTVPEIAAHLKEKNLLAGRHYIHRVRNLYWSQNPDKKPTVRRPDTPSNYDDESWKKSRNLLGKHVILNGTGISYSFFGSLSKMDQDFLIRELSAMKESVTISDWLRGLIVDARLDKEDEKETNAHNHHKTR